MNFKCSTLMFTLTAGFLITGCQKAAPPPPPPPPVVWHIPDERVDQVNELAEHVDVVRNTVAEMIGQSREQHQKSASQFFDELSKILRLSQGSATSPQFDSRMTIVDETKAVLAAQDMTPSRAEAAENEGLRAAIDILRVITARDLSADSQLITLLDHAHAKLSAMYSVSGPMHDMSASEGFTALSQVLNRMNTDYQATFRDAHRETERTRAHHE